MTIGKSAQDIYDAIKTKRIAADTSIAVGDTNVIVDTSGAAVAVTLPPVAECMGRIYTFLLAVAGNDLTFLDNANDSVDATVLEAYTLDVQHDSIVLMSNGVKWLILAVDEN